MTLPMVPYAESGPLYGFVLPTLISAAVTPGWAKARLGTSVSDRSARPAMRRSGARIGGPPWPSAGRRRGEAVVGGLYDHRRRLDGLDAPDRREDAEDSGHLVLATQRPAPLRAERPRQQRGIGRAGAAPRRHRCPGAPRRPCGHLAPLRRIGPSRRDACRDPSRRPTQADSVRPALLDAAAPRTRGRATRG